MNASNHATARIRIARRIRLAAPATIVAVVAAAATAQHPCDVFGNGFVKVILDMDAATPGCQTNVTIPAGTPVVRGVAVYIFDPLERLIVGIGYLGGIDRGIALGHMPNDECNRGRVAGLTPAVVAPVIAGNSQIFAVEPGLEKAFDGAEVQYIESGAPVPTPMPSNPAQPVFTVDVRLDGAALGDVYDFFLLDFVTVWTGGTHGAFSTRDAYSLDSGGDVVPDGTRTRFGMIDPDAPIPVPPAAFSVDYVDGLNVGPATITVEARRGDLNRDGRIDAADVRPFVNVLLDPSTPPPASVLADVNCDGRADGADVPGFVAALLTGV